MPSGQVFLSCDEGKLLGMEQMAYLLFAWDPRSFYGTMVSIEQWQGRQGIVLSAQDAVHYFSDVMYNREVNVTFLPNWVTLNRAARKIEFALSQGGFAPDFAAWQKGVLRWKLVDDTPSVGVVDEATRQVAAGRENQSWSVAESGARAQVPTIESDTLPVELFQHWFHYAVLQTLESEAVCEAWEKVKVHYPALSATSRDLRPFTDEVEWWTSLGLLPDTTPFLVGLALVDPPRARSLSEEPELESSWQLSILLQDKFDATHFVPLTATETDLPLDWLPHLDAIDKAQRRWLQVVPWLAEPSGQVKSSLGGAEALEFLQSASGQLMEAGERVYLPNWWEEARRLRARLKAKVKSSVGASRQSMLGVQQIVQFDWTVAIGDLDLTPEEFSALLANRRRLVEIRGRWVVLDEAFYKAALQTMKRVDKAGGLTLSDVLELHFVGGPSSPHHNSQEASFGKGEETSTSQLEADSQDESGLRLEVELNHTLTVLVQQLQEVRRLNPLPEPPGFRGALRPYQRLGYSWLVLLREFGLGACLADDMGLGKTVQYIAYLTHAAEGASLLICPTSVIGNWEKELRRFAPELKVYVHYGSTRKKAQEFLETVASSDLVLTTYGLVHVDEQHISQVVWDSLCLDEAQNIKNAYTKQAVAVRHLLARHRIAMTGTPIENRLTELWSLFDFLNPGYLGSLSRFRARFVNPIERTHDEELTRVVQRLVQPFLLRREKRDPAVELDLPDKLESKLYVPLTAEQAALYEATVQTMLRNVDRLSAMERRGTILTTLMKLKQICNHPVVFLKEGLSKQQPGQLKWEDMVRRSEKFTRLTEMVAELREEGDKCLIFTQFIDTGRLLQTVLEQRLGEEVLFLHGSISKQKRDEIIARFQSESLQAESFQSDSLQLEPSTESSRSEDLQPGPVQSGLIQSGPIQSGLVQSREPGVLILSLKAGGVGLNLTAANHVFHFDRWWNPAVENQATDRAYRIGQHRRVQVYKFVALGTLEERIDEMLEQKQSLSDQIIGSGENWITELSTEELRTMFALRREWVEE